MLAKKEKPFVKNKTAILIKQVTMTSLLSIILEKEQEKSRRGKNIRYAKGRKPIKSLTYGSPLDYELSLLFGSVCHASPKQCKKK